MIHARRFFSAFSCALGASVLAIAGANVVSPSQAQLFNKQQVCKTYADTAVLGYREGRRRYRCHIRTNARWHGNHKVHFDWCMAGGNWSAERDARDRVLNRCVPGWSPKL